MLPLGESQIRLWDNLRPCVQVALPAAHGQCHPFSLILAASQKAWIRVVKESSACDNEALPRNLGNKMLLPELLGRAVLAL